jgi:hypothetical protein
MTHARRRALAAVVSICCGLLLAVAPAAAAPADDILRIVPADAGFCLVVRDLRGHADRVLRSPFAGHIQAHALFKAIQAAPELEKLGEFEKFIEKQLQTTTRELRDEVLGDAVVVAFWPAHGVEPERGMFLTHARKPELLQAVVNRLQTALKASGDLVQVENRMHAGAPYQRWSQMGGKVNYVFVAGPILAITEHEPTLQKLLQNCADGKSDSGLPQRLRDLGVDQALATLWINPRSFDAAMQERLKAAPAAEQAFLANFLRYWKATQGVALALEADRDIGVRLAIELDHDRLPESARRLLAGLEKPADFWKALPPRPMLAIAARTDFSALFDVLKEFTPSDAWKRLDADLRQGAVSFLRRDLTREVLPYLGPSWGVCVSAPGPQSKTWFPHVVFGLEVKPTPNAESPLDQALFELLRTLAGLTTLPDASGTEPLVLKTEKQGDVSVVSLHGAKRFPPGFQPSFALKRSYLVLASAPAAIASFAQEPREAPAPRRSGDVLLARLWVKELAAYLEDSRWRPQLAEALGQANGLSAAEIGQRLDKVCAVLALFEEVDVVYRKTAKSIHIGVSLRPAKPLQP